MKSSIKAYAKINLFLDITGRLPNGYHTLKTVMQQIDLHDTLDIEAFPRESVSIRVSCDDPAVPDGEKNIAFRAAEAFLRETGLKAEVNIHIEKKIPLEAGLGGSSTDGAAVLSALNSILGEPLPKKRIFELGAALGADVPFCLCGGTALCGGIGECITPVDCPTDYVILLAKPDFSCNTAEAYRKYDISPVAAKEGFADFAKALPYGAKHWHSGVYNVFEALYADERIEEITRTMKTHGALSASLTGSGSAVFGIFTDAETAENARLHLKTPYKITARPIQRGKEG